MHALFLFGNLPVRLEMNGKEIEGREIAVKVAIDSPDKTDDDFKATEAEDTNGAEQVEAAPAVAAA